MPAEHVQLPLTGAGDSSVQVAVDSTPDGVIQLFKLIVSADGSSVFVPADAEGLWVQDISTRAVSPQDDLLTVNNLSAGVSSNLDATDITSGRTGRLTAADIGASVPLRVDLQTVAGSRVTRTTIYTCPGISEIWRPPGPTYVTLSGGTGRHFGCAVTNLSPSRAADASVTLYWDEV